MDGSTERESKNTTSVSYTHLDVYKRQALETGIMVMEPEGESAMENVIFCPAGKGKTPWKRTGLKPARLLTAIL